MIRNLITLHLVVWHFDIFCSRLPQWQPSLKGSDTCNILCLYIFNVQNISTHYKSAFLLFYVFAYWLLYNNIILLLFCATLYICISCFNHWQVIKVKHEPFSLSLYTTSTVKYVSAYVRFALFNVSFMHGLVLAFLYL